MQIASLFPGTHECGVGRAIAQNISLFNRLRFGETPNYLPSVSSDGPRQLFLNSFRTEIFRNDPTSIRCDRINTRRSFTLLKFYHELRA
jgi:hypothetical protein